MLLWGGVHAISGGKACMKVASASQYLWVTTLLSMAPQAFLRLKADKKMLDMLGKLVGQA